MGLSESTKSENASLTHDILSAARYYMGNRRVLLVLAVVAAVAGLALNWNWLVAIGLAPILLSTLPCLVMCAFGVCMMHRSGKDQAPVIREAIEKGASLAGEGALQSVGSCCHQSDDDAASTVSRQNLSKTAEPPRPEQEASQRPV